MDTAKNKTQTMSKDIEAALAKLPPGLRALVESVYLSDDTVGISQFSKIYEISEDVANRMHTNALRALRGDSGKSDLKENKPPVEIEREHLCYIS